MSPTGASRFSVGQEWDGDTPSNFFQGFIDEILVFDHTLSQAGVVTLMEGRYNPQDLVVQPNDSLDYDATVKNQLFNRYAQGLMATHFPIGAAEIAPVDFILNPQESAVLSGTLTVEPTAASGAYSLTQEVDALITDWREASDYSELLYHFAETVPPFEDSSGSQPPREGDCTGDACPTSVSGRYGKGLSFDGVDDYVTNDNVAKYLTGDAFTFGAWISTTSTMAGRGAVLAFNTDGAGNRNQLIYNADNQKLYYRDDEAGAVYASDAIASGTWHYAMVVVEADDSIRLYVNGREQAVGQTTVRPDPDGSLNIGQEWDGGSTTEHFQGRIDEAIVLDRALSPDEAAAYYSDPVLALPLDESPGAIRFEDTSAFANDARCRGERCPTSGVPGISGQAVELSGDNYLTVPSHSALSPDNGTFTLATWVYPEGDGDELSSCDFRAEYYSNRHLINNEDTVRRCESYPISHNWGSDTALPPDRYQDFYNYFSVRWTGTFLFREGSHTFHFEHDDGMRAWIDGDLLFEDWDDGSRSEDIARNITAGLHTIKVEYRETTGSARARVSWEPAPLPHPHGILGNGNYPSIERVGDRVQVRLNDAQTFISPAGSLAADKWQHVATTFDESTLVLYVDGTEVAQWAASGQVPASGDELSVGRTASDATVTLEQVSVLETADTNSGGDWPDELRLYLSRDGGPWGMVWSENNAREGDEFSLATSRTFEDNVRLRMLESDDGEYDHCFYGCDGEDPEDEDMGTVAIEALDLSPYDSATSFESDSSRYERDRADLLWYAASDSVPFEGRIDEVRIYQQAFDADAVAALYDAGTQILHMPCDDAPGVAEFADDGGDPIGSCKGDACPTSGHLGREGWALRFDGVDDVVTIEEANAENAETLTIAAWVKLDEMPAGQAMRFVTLEGEKAVLRYDGASGTGQLHFYATIDGALKSVRADNALATDRWLHVAGTYDGSALRLYVNGQLQGTTPVSGALGDGNSVTLSAAGETLNGLIDEILILRRAMSDGEIDDLVEEVPQLILALDEAETTDSFVDSSGNDNDAACNLGECPSAGAKGQLGLSSAFDGADDNIDIHHDAALMPDNAMSLVAWVRIAEPDVDQKIAGKAAGSSGYVLGIEDGQLYPEVWNNAGTRYSGHWGHINADVWTFVAFTWRTGGELVAYINGEIAGSVDAGTRPIGAVTTPFRVGAAPWHSGRFLVNGRVDHVLLYHRALSPSEMRAAFRAQAKWVEERQETKIVVDAEPPVSTLVSDDVYRPNQDVVLLVATEDEVSPVTMLEMQIGRGASILTPWQSAPPCRTTASVVGGETPWCPTFEPLTGEGLYELQFRATDDVGTRETPGSTYTFLIDDTPPVPDTDIAEGTKVKAEPRPGETWLVPLSGAVIDPAIAGTAQPGSGVADVRVKLTATAHPTDTLEPKTATLGTGAWSVDYPLHYADATGTYTLSVQATDEVGNVGDFETLITLGLDTAAPVASMDAANTMTMPISSTLTLTGRVTETGVVSTGLAGVRVGFLPAAMVAVSRTVATFQLDEPPTSSSFASGNADIATCDGTSCPTAGTDGVWGTALTFDGDDDFLTADFVSAAVTDTGGFAFGAWVLPVDDGSTGAILSFHTANGSNRNQLVRTNYRYCYYDEDLGRKCSALHAGIDDMWRLVVVSITEDGHGTLFIDGEVGLNFETSVRPEPDGRFSIGQEWDGTTPTDFLEGRIDEVVIYDRALAAQEVTAMFAEATLATAGDGVLETDWDLMVPEGLEGLYSVRLRPSDVFSNTPPSDWEAWNGEIDTRGPLVDMTVEEETSYLGLGTTYTCWAEDYNLVGTSEDHPEYDFDCPCRTLAPLATVVTPTYYHEVSPWYAGTFTDTNRLYRLEASCSVVGPALADSTMQACDIHGHCEMAIGEPSEIIWVSPIDSGVLTPTVNSVVTSTAALLLEGSAYARDYLQSMTVTVDGGIIDTETWSCLDLTTTTWASTWLVPTEGEHVLSTQVIDCNNQHQDFHRPVKVLIDTIPPAVDISPLVLTTTHRLSRGRVALAGHATDINGIAAVEVKVEDGDWQTASLFDTDWQLDWHIGEEPAGEDYTVTARATDLGGHTTRITQTVHVNLETPNPITLTLKSAGTVVTPGTTLRTMPTTLDLTWVTETQQTDLLPYEIAWTVYTTQTSHIVRLAAPPQGPLASTYVAGEAQRVRPRVISRLLDGNSQSDVYGTVTVDSPVTPDYISLETAPGERRPYLGWMESGCTQLGIDRRIAESVPQSAALDDEQTLFATWGSEALRLAWTGANWSYAGDLFVYLDTAAGGALQAMNPYSIATGSSVSFPENLDFGADALIWIEDGATAHLFTWNPGSEEWDSQRLTPDEFRFEPGLNNGHTDLYLPFDMLGITDPATSPLAMVAFASEEDRLEIWGTMPPTNPVSSPRVVDTDVFAQEVRSFGLMQVYVFPLLAPGLCPSAPFGDGDVRVALTTEPAGTAFSLLGSDVVWLWEELTSEDRSADFTKALTFLDVDHPLLKHGDTVTYTLAYENRGSETATGVQVVATGLAALRFGGGITHTVSLGSIGPGASGTVAFQGEIDRDAARTDYYEPCLSAGSEITCSQFLDWAVLQAAVIDPTHGLALPLDLLWATHEVDGDPPEFYDVAAPAYYVSPGINELRGYAFDPSGVPELDIVVQTPSSTTACTDPTPDDSSWACQWDATQANGGTAPADGTAFDLRLRPTDGGGIQATDLTPWRGFVVDAVAPSGAYDAQTTSAYSGNVVADTSLAFSGVISDNHGVASVEVCLNSVCDAASVQAAGQASTVVTDAVGTPAPIPDCVSPLVRTFEVTETFAVGQVQLGLNVDHERRNDITATLTSPDGTSVNVLGPRPGTPFEAAGIDVWLADNTGVGLHDAKTDDATGTPLFDREIRPNDPLRVFRDETAAGTWTLSLCDWDPITKTGTYSQSRLVIAPRDTSAQEGTWSYAEANLDDVDGLPYAVELVFVDVVGNRGAGDVLNFELDNVPPALSGALLNEVIRMSPERNPVRVLGGSVADGGSGEVRMNAFVWSPKGKIATRQVGQSVGTWWFDLAPDEAGLYKVWINAIDAADNTSTVGPYEITVVRLTAASDSPIPRGAQALLTATLEGDTGYAYTWDPGDGTGPLAGAVATHAYDTLGAFTATVTATKAADAFTATTAIDVAEGITGLSVINDSPTVVSETTTLTATVLSGSDVAYAWDLGDGTCTYGDIVRHIYSEKGLYLAVVTATNTVTELTTSTHVYIGIEPGQEHQVYLPLVVK